MVQVEANAGAGASPEDTPSVSTKLSMKFDGTRFVGPCLSLLKHHTAEHTFVLFIFVDQTVFILDRFGYVFQFDKS